MSPRKGPTTPKFAAIAMSVGAVLLVTACASGDTATAALARLKGTLA